MYASRAKTKNQKAKTDPETIETRRRRTQCSPGKASSSSESTASWKSLPCVSFLVFEDAFGLGTDYERDDFFLGTTVAAFWSDPTQDYLPGRPALEPSRNWNLCSRDWAASRGFPLLEGGLLEPQTLTRLNRSTPNPTRCRSLKRSNSCRTRLTNSSCTTTSSGLTSGLDWSKLLKSSPMTRNLLNNQPFLLSFFFITSG